MPQVLDSQILSEIRREVEEVELDVEIKGYINLLVRDFQTCIRNREFSDVKPLALCEGCHFIRDVCSSIRVGPSERTAIVLTQLAKAKTWLDGSVSWEDLLEMAFYVMPHRITLTKTRNILSDLRELLNREKAKMRDREGRRQWFILNELTKNFNRGLYNRAREIALEDMVFAEELSKLEGKWIKEGKVKPEESVTYNLGMELS